MHHCIYLWLKAHTYWSLVISLFEMLLIIFFCNFTQSTMLHTLLIQSYHLLLGNCSMMQSHICVWNRYIPNKCIVQCVNFIPNHTHQHKFVLWWKWIILNTNIANGNDFCFIDLFRTMKVPSIVRDLMWCFLLLVHDFKKVGKGSTTKAAHILVVSLHRKFWQRLFIRCCQLRIISHLNIVQLTLFLIKF